MPGRESTRIATVRITRRAAGRDVHSAFTSGSRARNSSGRGPREPYRRVERASAEATPAAIGPADAANGVYRAGELEVRPAEHMALVGERPLALTVRELALLAELARNGNRVVTREQLFVSVWGRRWRSSDRSVDVYVSRLRNKLAAALPDTCFIHTHFGIGYRFSPEPLPGENAH